jgi:hypothetical protein
MAMNLSWSEIRARAASFAKKWATAHYERGDTQSFYNDFFLIFGLDRKRVAVFERSVDKLKGSRGFIDLFWPGVLIVEQKSFGKDLLGARIQALDYTHGLDDREMPRFVLACDFRTFLLTDLETREETAFPLTDLHKHVERFGFMLGRQVARFKDQDPVNVRAAELVGHLHDLLAASGYTGHRLEVFLVRIVFCLFADDTGIFEPRDRFLDWLETESRTDGSDLGARLGQLFDVLNTPETGRQTSLGDDLRGFPYINGHLFEEVIPPPAFDSGMRAALINACRFDWAPISPAIFGSLFQSVMNRSKRRRLGAHYTSHKNILKVIQPLFLDELWAAFAAIRSRKIGKVKALESFLDRLSKLRFLDPACGCGNFLVVAYGELREIELAVLKELHADGQLALDATALSRVDVDQFYGIEIEEFPAKIAETAMWMTDHLMNQRLSAEFGRVFVRIPLRKAAMIRHGDALSIDWEEILPSGDCAFVMGNPPFVGHQFRSAEQVTGMHRVWGTKGQFNRLDFVTCWFKKAVTYGAPFAFVSTNSITQGEQAGILWPVMFGAGWHISFAHRTFQWNSEARGKAAVHCVIIGMTRVEPGQARVFDYDTPRSEPMVSGVRRLNGYLVNGTHWAVPSRGRPQDGQKDLFKGSQPTDGARLKKPDGGYETTSNLILDAHDRTRLATLRPSLDRWLRPFVGSDELISGQWRYCLWLRDAPPADYDCPEVRERLKRVRFGRQKSPTASVRDWADFPTLFTQDRQPSTAYLAIPEVSSESRDYIPMAFLPANVIASNKLMIMPGATLEDFAILTSRMHMAWMRVVSGRMKSDYSYSPAIYFSFPMPRLDTDALEPFAQAVLDARNAHAEATLEVLYDPDMMPPNLREAHRELDRAVDRLYRKEHFASDRERVEHLFSLHQAAAAPLLPPAKQRRHVARTIN